MSKGKLSGSPFHIEYNKEKYYVPCAFRDVDKTCGNAASPVFMHFCFNSWKCIYKNGDGTSLNTNNNDMPIADIQKNLSKIYKEPLPIYSERKLYIIDNRTKRKGKCPDCGEGLIKAPLSFIVYTGSDKAKVIGLSEVVTVFCPKCNNYYASAGIKNYINEAVEGYADIVYIENSDE